MVNIALLEEICKAPGAPGYEEQIRNLILKKLEPLADDVRIDPMGNVIAFRKGQSQKKLMLTAHMDEISFMVTHIDENGFLRFHTLGGFDPKTLTAQRVLIHGKKEILGVMGTKPIHSMTADEKTKAPKIQDFFVDTGLSVEEVKQNIEIGTTITRERGLVEMGDCVNAKSLDNRVSVYILLESLKALQEKELPCDVYAVFTVQEEVGIRGAMTAAAGINPDYGINLDVTVAYDLPGAAPHEAVTRLGHGAAIKVYDSSVICDYRMIDFMKKMAQQHEINHQMEILTAGGTDTAGIQRGSQGGAIAGAISIPTRYLHQVIEMANKRDIEDCCRLLEACILGIGDYNWAFR